MSLAISILLKIAQIKAPRIINFKEDTHVNLYSPNLTNTATLNNCMLVFDCLNSNLPVITDDLFKS